MIVVCIRHTNTLPIASLSASTAPLVSATTPVGCCVYCYPPLRVRCTALTFYINILCIHLYLMPSPQVTVEIFIGLLLLIHNCWCKCLLPRHHHSNTQYSPSPRFIANTWFGRHTSPTNPPRRHQLSRQPHYLHCYYLLSHDNCGACVLCIVLRIWMPIIICVIMYANRGRYSGDAPLSNRGSSTAL